MTLQSEKITVLIADDHVIVRQGLRTLLGLMEDIQIVGEAENGCQAVDLVARLKPDVILMDLVMPEVDGITATREIIRISPKTRVIALTSFLEDEKIIPVIQAGATSFLLKDVTPNELIEAIRAAFHGQAHLNPIVARRLMDLAARQPEKDTPPFVEQITGREMEVLQLVAQGMNNKSIAESLVISEKTVKTHISSLLGKLQVKDRTQLAVHALKSGWLMKDEGP